MPIHHISSYAVSNLIQFVANHDDLSTDKGFQFKFYCDKCRNGHMSRFQPSAIGIAGSVLNAAGSLFGGFFHEAGNAAYQMQRAIGGKAHDEALEKAVLEGKQHFKQCTRCGGWVCPDVCWNHRAGLCETCAPDEHEELAAQQALATSEQIREKTRTQDYTKSLDFLNRTGIVQCTGCSAKLSPTQKFCPECGTTNAAAQQSKEKFCTDCGGTMKADQRFCAECGARQ
ncbi:zinc ribbon domain-containing protein [Hymenobacter sp. BT175]|uniref:zinc ribbon domain-containing protein n=1 Tax=Hymenobacter translucens TaxID=2886507 RepID=UPI001D0F29A9|nr:zinc ribbon domain-containing protein [Hymenobacter translucens]MCC2546541.1 zinc ribbon domain-containing protein [Hymenobacter translucens]